MARRFEAIVCTDVTLQAAAEVGERLREWLLREEILLPELNAEQAHPAGSQAVQTITCSCGQAGVDGDFPGAAKLIIGRNIYWSEWGHNLHCPVCQYAFEPEDDEALEAMAQWERGEPAGEVGCPDCGLRRPLTDWDSDWGYGNLGIEFWDWQPLAYSFVHRVGRLTDSRVTVAHGGRG
ncbi:hypothetical protein [Micromonospora avicenniae]|uniref:Uncharacterized protein n=1 Tax=Micromonospora avicenniae TaxID=1198245 RepID=A0A1N7EF18_9ACTN|nr:hypothetical protein [Micromonospora avicenniae]SIR86691.1 hypothetical protein SAMN05444858_12311 [Micromonospora avicenniae]